MNTTDPYDVTPEVREDGWLNEDHLLLAVGVGTGLLFSLALLAIIASLACRGQHIRQSRRSRRLTSTVSMAYSDFETYKVARPIRSSSPSTNLSTLTSSSLSQIYASPYKTRTVDKSAHPDAHHPDTNDRTGRPSQARAGSVGQYETRPENAPTMVLGGWRYIEPIVQPISSANITHSEERKKKTPIVPTEGRRHSDLNPTTVRNQESPSAFSTRILSPAYTGKTKRDDQTRPSNTLEAV